MNAPDLIRATFAGERTARSPVSFWTHFPDVDLDPEALARRTLAFAGRLDLDLIKAMPNGLYCVEDWGVVADYSEVAAGGVAKVVKSPVAGAADWAGVRRLDETAGALGRELRHLDLLLAGVGARVPVLATVFSPLTIARKLCPDGFDRFLQTDRAAVKAALDRIADTTRAFAARAIGMGCAGVFFAVQDATPGIGAETYAELGRPYDLRVLEGAAQGWCNAVHLHGDDVLFDAVADYPVQALNWHIGETEPGIAAYRVSGGTKAVLGGLRRANLTRADYDGIAGDLASARAADGARGVIFAPGCVIRHPCDLDVLKRVADMIRSGT